MSDLKLVLMKRDEITSDEADDLIKAAREELFELIDQGEIEEAENICEYHFGLEADYIMDLRLCGFFCGAFSIHKMSSFWD